MSANRRQTVLASAALVAGALLMTACQDSDSGAAQGASSNASNGQAPASPNTSNSGGSQGGNSQGSQGGSQGGGDNSTGKSSSGGQGTSAGNGTTSGGGSGKASKCRTDELKVTALDNTISGDRDGSVAVTFKNNGPDCSMAGFAGVNLKTDAGDISAERTSQEPVSIVLKAGKSVSFTISYPVETMGEASGLRITGLVVTPPDETKSVTIDWPGAGRFPVKSGGDLVKVGPIGSAGQGG
ncbi:DUF4232 domain-containing protein [Yinghuangia aomiensis]|uniref:DUF4232 domain-containing protein n=1 Tax=Yinghuangia aomiensis TaxID=676205 RepID=A0ABP9HEB9_9ACTN